MADRKNDFPTHVFDGNGRLETDNDIAICSETEPILKPPRNTEKNDTNVRTDTHPAPLRIARILRANVTRIHLPIILFQKKIKREIQVV